MNRALRATYQFELCEAAIWGNSIADRLVGCAVDDAELPFCVTSEASRLARRTKDVHDGLVAIALRMASLNLPVERPSNEQGPSQKTTELMAKDD